MTEPPPSGPPPEGVLPGWALDLITDGVRLGDHPRSAIVKAIRRISLTAHRNGVPYTRLEQLMMNPDTFRLAKQFATGKGGRTIAPGPRRRHLQRIWADTSALAAAAPAWDRDTALDFIEHARTVVGDGVDGLTDRENQVLLTVIDLATEYGTTRPVCPQRVIADRTGIPHATVARILHRLAADGDWLGYGTPGNALNRRATTYRLAPGLRSSYGRTTSACDSPPTYDSPTYDSLSEASVSTTVTITAPSPEALRDALRTLAGADPRQVEQAIDTTPEARHLRVVKNGTAS